jgi:NADH:ubiquinone oxidoreductase subunit 2 (subunit N)
MQTRWTARRPLVALALGVSLALLSAGVALAEAPHHVWLPDAACNQGTAAARIISGNGIVPMYMSSPPIGCMTMPGAFQP